MARRSEERRQKNKCKENEEDRNKQEFLRKLIVYSPFSTYCILYTTGPHTKHRQVHSLLWEPLLPTAVILVPSLWLSRLKEKIKTHRQQDYFISFLLFFQHKEDFLVKWKATKKRNRNELCF
jgi:hypothetical protein